MKNIEISQIIDESLYEWYSERGMEVPNWRGISDVERWQKFLDELDIEEG